MPTTSNPYIKQFPELCSDKKILYVHGFASSGQSGTVGRIRQVLPSATVVAPDLPVNPQEALTLLHEVCSSEQPDLIIGTSMGGMYAEQLAGYDRILVNPAFCIADTMAAHGLTGKQQFFSPRRDGVQEFYVDKPLVKAYRQATEGNFASADAPGEQKRVFGLFGDEDNLVNTFDLFASHYHNAIPFHGGHRMSDQSFMHAVVPVIRWIDDSRQRRQRPQILVGMETLADAYGHPLASAQKTLRTLIESYHVQFVATAPAAPNHYGKVTAWLRQYVGVPAWEHVVFTNSRQALLADYLVTTAAAVGLDDAGLEAWDGMATLVPLHTDTFKTWDDVASYFALLGGQ